MDWVKAKAAVLKIIGPTILVDEEPAVIRHNDGTFTLYAIDSLPIATSEHPYPLARYAEANGAVSVVHDYDLGIVE